MCVGAHAHTRLNTQMGSEDHRENQFSPFTMRVPGIKLGSPRLAAAALTCRALSQAEAAVVMYIVEKACSPTTKVLKISMYQMYKYCLNCLIVFI